jgi:predicted RNase H-like nuclease (RuvC/YqgF family)
MGNGLFINHWWTFMGTEFKNYKHESANYNGEDIPEYGSIGERQAELALGAILRIADSLENLEGRIVNLDGLIEKYQDRIGYLSNQKAMIQKENYRLIDSNQEKDKKIGELEEQIKELEATNERS